MRPWHDAQSVGGEYMPGGWSLRALGQRGYGTVLGVK